MCSCAADTFPVSYFFLVAETKYWTPQVKGGRFSLFSLQFVVSAHNQLAQGQAGRQGDDCSQQQKAAKAARGGESEPLSTPSVNSGTCPDVLTPFIPALDLESVTHSRFRCLCPP